MGKAKFFFGAIGAGTKIKLCVNMTMGSLMCAFSEGFSLCASSGMDSAKLFEVLGLRTAVRCSASRVRRCSRATTRPTSRSSTRRRTCASPSACRAVRSRAAASAGLQAMKRAMDDDGLGEQDFSSVFESVKKQKC